MLDLLFDVFREAVLYTEMVTSTAIVYRHKNQNIQTDLEHNVPIEHPVVLQLGGADPIMMKEAANIASTQYK